MKTPNFQINWGAILGCQCRQWDTLYYHHRPLFKGWRTLAGCIAGMISCISFDLGLIKWYIEEGNVSFWVGGKLMWFLKKFTVRGRLIISHSMMAIMTILIALFANACLKTINNNFSSLLTTSVVANTTVKDIRIEANSAANSLSMLIYSENQDMQETYIKQINSNLETIQSHFDTLTNSYSIDDGFDESYISIVKEWMQSTNQVVNAIQANDYELAKQKIVDENAFLLNQLNHYAINLEEELLADETRMAVDVNRIMKNVRIIIVVLLALGIVGACILIILINRSIVVPLLEVENAAKEMSKGNIHTTITYQSKDAIGRLADAMRVSMDTLNMYINEIGNAMHAVSSGDFTYHPNLDFAGDFEQIETNIVSFIGKMDVTLKDIRDASQVVLSECDQISNASQSLAQGASEQAASIEELCATISEVTTTANEIATNALSVDNEAKASKALLLESDQHMTEMVDAMNALGKQSDEIEKIIKTIEDIAFQTNILALNAAVEAARAGQAGKGFAVVADEVRNLAGKSAEAAKETTVLINNNSQAINNGRKIAFNTAESLKEAVNKTNQVVETVDAVSESIEKQSVALSQISIGMDQISSVVQTNSATSEETAASSVTLDEQAKGLMNIVDQFNLK